MYLYVRTRYVCICKYVRKYVGMCVCMNVYMHVRTYVCIDVRMYICICVLYMHVYMYVRRGKSPNMGRCIISYQMVLCCLLKNVNDQAHEAVLCNQIIKGQLLGTSVLTGRIYFGAL